MLKNLILFCFLMSPILILGQEESQITAALPVKTFVTDADNNGAIANSVNKFTGDVNLPINLISLQGENGLNVAVSAMYNSNIHTVIDTWNYEAPTGILGLGWSLGYPKIIADHKFTAARDDDEFYLFEGGNNKLICVNMETNYKEYVTENYQFWKIKYYFDDEKWEIIKEDGTIYIYGDEVNDPTAVQYLVKWGNWIGNSSQSQGNPSQHAIAWNLSRIRNRVNQEIRYEYYNQMREVKNTGVYHTEASYLSKITDAHNRTVEFTYDEKSTDEIGEPYCETAEPDAYQEQYERLYLSSISVKNRNALKLLSVHFEYDSTGTGTLKKRLLKTITQKNSNDEELPPMRFTYWTDTADVNRVALKTVETSMGSLITFNYTQQEIQCSDRLMEIQDTVGYTNTYTYSIAGQWITDDRGTVFNSLDYSVIIMRKGDSLKVNIFDWIGSWKLTEFEIFYAYPADTDQNFRVQIQKDFFAINTNINEDHTTTDLYLFKRDNTTSEWGQELHQFNRASENPSVLFSGNNFVGIYYSNNQYGYVQTYTSTDGGWRTDTNRMFTEEDLEGDRVPARVCANNNYYILHNRYADPEMMFFYYLTEESEWKGGGISSIPFINSNINTNWYAFDGFALGMIGDNPEYILKWDENYTNFNFVQMNNLPESVIAMQYSSGNTVGLGTIDGTWATCFYTDGYNWNELDMGYALTLYSSSVSYGDNFIVKKNGHVDNDEDWRLFIYKPDSLIWTDYSLSSSFASPRITASHSFFVFGDRILCVKLAGNLSKPH